ncbi:Hypothetical predicted protein, partial [Pelobates cultripes]
MIFFKNLVQDTKTLAVMDWRLQLKGVPTSRGSGEVRTVNNCEDMSVCVKE